MNAARRGSDESSRVRRSEGIVDPPKNVLRHVRDRRREIETAKRADGLVRWASAHGSQRSVQILGNAIRKTGPEAASNGRTRKQPTPICYDFPRSAVIG